MRNRSIFFRWIAVFRYRVNWFCRMLDSPVPLFLKFKIFSSYASNFSQSFHAQEDHGILEYSSPRNKFCCICIDNPYSIPIPYLILQCIWQKSYFSHFDQERKILLPCFQFLPWDHITIQDKEIEPRSYDLGSISLFAANAFFTTKGFVSACFGISKHYRCRLLYTSCF